MHILFVDDMPDTRDIFRLAFGIQGHTTRVATNGLEAVEAVKEESFDAIIMDVEMPEMNGWDAVGHIRQLKNGNQLPIIMFTAYGGDEDYDHAIEVGANCLMLKPILPQELLNQIEKLRS
ncbi:MAG: response regulator [Abitibacteriaceae bacterium]|nr:response regulator [Abditibacteriaceae bacterium]MBV9868358.1 response regulator [Abditibacteriaceae bacterium]